jgi:hypothetical protein
MLQNWYVERFGPMSPDPVSHAQSLNFAALRDFIDALLECYLADTEGSSPTHAQPSGMKRQMERSNADVAVR